MQFPGIIGNAEVKQALSDAFTSGRFPHAIILQGEPGTGKRSFARLLANALVCSNTELAPCGVCSGCIMAKAGSHPDIWVEEGSGKSHSITVEAVKNINEDAYRMPEKAPYSVFLLFIENKISEIVQNKLLKLIEEPPANTVFIMTCSFADQLLPTVRSRMQIFTLRAPDIEEAAAVFKDKLPEDEALQLAEVCGGNIGKMLQEQNGGILGEARKTAKKIAALLTLKDEHALLAAAAPLIKNRFLTDEVLTQLHLIFRDACVSRIGGDVFLSDAQKERQGLENLPVKSLFVLQALPLEYRKKLMSNANMALLVTSLCAEMRNAVGR